MTSRTAGKAFTARPQLSPFVGIGLRSSHIEEVLTRRPDVGWFEIHAENYMRNPAALRLLEQVRMRYPLSLHGVALSLGSAGPLDRDHLAGLKELVDRLDPFLVSEHMAWSSVGGDYLNDLLPLPCTEEALETMISHVAEVQHTLDRRILVENPSGYLRFEHSTMGEANFLAELVRRTGCGLLCDVNNIYVSASNLGFDVDEYMMVLPVSAVGEIHLAGHSANILESDSNRLCNGRGLIVRGKFRSHRSCGSQTARHQLDAGNIEPSQADVAPSGCRMIDASEIFHAQSDLCHYKADSSQTLRYFAGFCRVRWRRS